MLFIIFFQLLTGYLSEVSNGKPTVIDKNRRKKPPEVVGINIKS
jgi:hypothetical protein